jgi:rhamnosyl/mannosyltransferase
MPAVLIEAGLCAMPTITCPVGEITEVVLHGRTGLVVPIGDQDAVTAALTRLATHPEEAAQFGRAARDHCLQRFTIDVVAEQWLAVLRRVAADDAPFK